MLGADHAGFLTRRWADAFLDCCEQVLGAEVDRARSQVSYRGHVCGIGVHPLGVDAADLRQRAGAPDVEAQVAALTEATGGRQLIVRIDRTELSKNIVRGLAAYRELLATHPELHGQVTHLAFAYPSRDDLPEYRAYTDSVQRMAAQITEEFGTPSWDPLILDLKDEYATSLAAYRMADVMVVNPIRDGMNLVAKEAPIVSERGCALVLSREAGACAELGQDALVVNPYDVTATARAMYEGLTMPRAERARRCAALARAGAALPPARWLADQLDALSCSPAASQPSRSTTPAGPSTTRSAAAASSVTSAEPLHTATPGMPWPRSSPRARNAGRSPRSSPQNSTTREARSEITALSAAPLSIPRGRSSITIRPGWASRPSASASRSSGGAQQPQRRVRVGGPPGVHRDRVALVLGPGARRARRPWRGCRAAARARPPPPAGWAGQRPGRPDQRSKP